MNLEKLERQTETLALINDELTSRLARQSDSLTKIDNKAVLVIGYALAAASFLAVKHAQPTLTALAYVAYAAAAGFGIMALVIRNYADIEPRPLLTRYSSQSRAATLAVLTANRVQDFELNRSYQQTKARRWQMGLAALLLGTMLMVAAILVQT